MALCKTIFRPGYVKSNHRTTFWIVLTRRQTSLVESLNDRHDPVKLRSEAQVLWWRWCIQGLLNCVHGWNTWYWSKGTMGGHGVFKFSSFQVVVVVVVSGAQNENIVISAVFISSSQHNPGWNLLGLRSQLKGKLVAKHEAIQVRVPWICVFFLKVSLFFFPEFVYLKMFSDTWWCLNLQWKFGMYLYIRADYQNGLEMLYILGRALHTAHFNHIQLLATPPPVQANNGCTWVHRISS